MRIEETIAHFKLSNMEIEILSNCLKGKFVKRLGEFTNTLVVLGLKGLTSWT